MRDAALVRHGYTHRERAVLWGTSLQQYEALHLGLNTDLDSPSLVGTLFSSVPAMCAWGWVGARPSYYKPASRPLDALVLSKC
jgi:hypothetical protein